MMQPYTEKDLIRFLYHETTTEENHGIAFQLEDDGVYNQAFSDLLTAKRLLNSVPTVAPSQRSVDRILAYSLAAH